jgi:methylenetetrahydrofolate dehydrogenase (NADP+)/methenyltetrahydrofolate cyclohydrolase
MSAQIIDGTKIAAQITESIRERIARMERAPGITVVLVGDDPASNVYTSMKEVNCRKAGMRSEKIALPAQTSEGELLAIVERLNKDDSVDGILVQLPLPKHISDSRIIRCIDPAKDVDGLHPINLGLTQLGKGTLVPCTPKGIMRLLTECRVPIAGVRAVVVGRSNIVGKPIAQLLLHQDATVTICHSKTRDLASVTRQADILIAAVGVPKLITADMIKPGATVIDVGVNRVPDPSAPKGYALVGDVDFEGARSVAGAITPVPGGVGPMTIAMLMENTLLAAEARK